MTEPPENVIQAIDFDETFNPDFPSFMKTQGIASLAHDYDVVSVIGAQSSGKSTLLNLLFKTPFATMDSQKGRSQTTQGVWLGRDPDRNIVVLDLEGTDSAERGGDSLAWERKSALFALAVSDVMMVNLWTAEVGRFNAANLATLKTILELDLKLFAGGVKSGGGAVKQKIKPLYKTKLLFVLRDQIERSDPMDHLSERLNGELSKIWASIAKPPGYEESSIHDFFDLAFFGIPHKVLMEDEFRTKCAELRDAFGLPINDPSGIFQSEYRRGVSGDGFATYAENVWAVVHSNKELDIPSQMKMLANVRCEEISGGAFEIASADIEKLNESHAEDKLIEDFGKSMARIYETTLTQYSEEASRYDAEISKAKELNLRQHLDVAMGKSFGGQSILVVNAAKSSFDIESKEILLLDSPWVGIDKKLASVMKDAHEVFSAQCKFPQSENLSSLNALYDAEEKKFRTYLEEKVNDLKAKVASVALEKGEDMFVGLMAKPLAGVIDKGKEDVWTRTNTVVETAWGEVSREQQAVIGSDGLSLDEKSAAQYLSALQQKCFTLTKKELQSVVGTKDAMFLRIMDAFDSHFRHDDKGGARIWKSHVKIGAIYDESKTLAEATLDRLATPTLTLGPHKYSATVLSPDEREFVLERFRAQSISRYDEAKRVQDAMSERTKIPWWIYLVIVVFGFNEGVYVMKNPVLLMLLLIVLPVAYVFYAIDSWPVVPEQLQPVVEFKQLVVGKVSELKEIVKTTLNDDPTPQGAAGAGAESATSAVSSS